MLQLKWVVPLLGLVILLNSCDGHGKLHIVVNNGSDYHMDIKRQGWVEFTKDSTAIKSMEPGGYLLFEKNDTLLKAEYDEKTGIYMELYENDKLIPNETGKTFLAAAVKEMVARNVGSPAQ